MAAAEISAAARSQKKIVAWERRACWIWCPEPESNRYAGFTLATDFKSVVSTNFTTRAEVRKRQTIPNQNQGSFDLDSLAILIRFEKKG